MHLGSATDSAKCTTQTHTEAPGITASPYATPAAQPENSTSTPAIPVAAASALLAVVIGAVILLILIAVKKHKCNSLHTAGRLVPAQTEDPGYCKPLYIHLLSFICHATAHAICAM